MTALPDGRLFFYGSPYARGVTASGIGDALKRRLERSNSNGTPPQVWNPGTRNWTSVEHPPECRYHAVLATATLMPDARVLIAGGLCDAPRMRDDTSPALPHTRISLWNGADGQWERLDGLAPALSAPRVLHTASLLADGSVLIAGGETDPLHTSDGRPAVLASVERYRDGRIEPAAAMQTARAQHTATPQADGSMLVVGGRDGAGQALASVEMWDSAAARWVTAPPLRHPRLGHRAVTLDDGRVLVAGGVDSDGRPLASVEIWDPVARAWSAGQPLPIPLSEPALTRLANGDVLAAGGSQLSNDIAMALLWRKAEARWVPAGSAAKLNQPVLLAASSEGAVRVFASSGTRLWRPLQGDRPSAHPNYLARERHAATVMNDGRILLSGGVRSRQFVDVAEVFDPDSGSFSITGRMNLARHSHQGLALSDGRVVVAGGWARSVDDPAHPKPPTPEVWDSSTGLWHLIPGMDLAPQDQVHVGSSVGGSVLFLASRELFEENATEPPSFRAWRWTPRTGEIERLTVPLRPRAGGAIAIRSDGTVFAAGGRVWTERSRSDCASDPHACGEGVAKGRLEPDTSAELWLAPMFGDKPGIVQTLASMPTVPASRPLPAQALTLILRDNSVLVNFYDPYPSRVEPLPMLRWDGESGRWSALPALASVEGGRLVELADGRLLSPTKQLEAGAAQWVSTDARLALTPLQLRSGRVISVSMEPPHLRQFDTRTASWQTRLPVDASPSWQKRPVLAVLPKQRVMMIGNVGERVDTAHIWDSTGRTWTHAGKLARSYRRAQTVALASGQVLHLGQLDEQRHVCERWRPADNEWASCGTLNLTAGEYRAPKLGALADGRAALVKDRNEALVFDESDGAWHAMPLEVAAQTVPPGAPIRMDAGYYARVQDTTSKQWVDASDLVARYVQRHGASATMLWSNRNQEWAYVFHDGNALGQDAMWLPDGCAISLWRMRVFNPKTGLITPLQHPLTDVDLRQAAAAVLDDGTVVAAAEATYQLPGAGVFFRRKAGCSGFEPARGEEAPLSSGRPRAEPAAAPPVAQSVPWTDRLRSALTQAWDYRWLALALMLPMLGYGVARRHAGKRAAYASAGGPVVVEGSGERNAAWPVGTATAKPRPSRGFRWALRAIFYGVAAVVIVPMLIGYIAFNREQRQEGCAADPSACLDERGLIERVPALVTRNDDQSRNTRIPCRYVGVWSSIRPNLVLRITLHDDGRYVAVRNLSGSEASAHDRYEGHWAVQGRHMLWRHTRNDPGRPDVNRIVDESEGRLTLVEENDTTTRFERLEAIASQRCVP